MQCCRVWWEAAGLTPRPIRLGLQARLRARGIIPTLPTAASIQPSALSSAALFRRSRQVRDIL